MNRNQRARDDALCVHALSEAGVHVHSTLDLINRSGIPEAIPVLIDLLPRVEDALIREAIIRALSVREAAGVAARSLLNEYRRTRESDPEGQSQKVMIGFALSMTGDDSIFEELVEIIHDAEHGVESRGPIVLALGRMQDFKGAAASVLVDLLADDHLRLWAVMALGELGVPEVESRLVDISRDDAEDRVRAAAKEALRQVQRNR